ncbi:MAG: ATP-binding cassette domain-containing protein [Dehalococcoidia bacterium]|nr:ATP-binding cassette domain-containing protein [Dehalococcoidia bacterium]
MIATLRGVTYAYPGAPDPALDDVSLDLADGEFALVAGPSAGGKSTFLRLFNGLVPQFHGGRLGGELRVAWLDPSRTPARRMAAVAGMVFQEPEAQAIAETVEDEVAFGMEQHGVPPAEMRRRLDDLLAAVGAEHLRHRRLATLSGGERQRVAIAAVLALEPRLLLMDEPTSQLDPAGAAAVLDVVHGLHRSRGLTVLAAEHRLERLLPVVDRVVEVEAGRVAAMSPREAAARLRAVPPVCELGRRFAFDLLPLTVDEARPLAQRAGLRASPPPAAPAPGDELLRADGLTAAYGEHVALRGATFALREGEVVALVGANGSGKSTLFRALTGLLKPSAGAVSFCGAPAPDGVQARTALAGLVPQDPALALHRDTVRDEVAETLKFRRMRGAGDAALAAWNVAELAARNPRDLSVGQQQRVAVAAMLAHGPRAWLMDEPTRGADGATKAWLAVRLREHAAAGGAAIVATHDLESAARFATRVIGMDRGELAFDLPAREAFASSGPLPTQVARVVAGAVVVEDVA